MKQLVLHLKRIHAILCPGDSRSGVALIITIGLLALLLLLAFSFTVSMKTERAAAVAATDGMQARQAVLTSLARAAADVPARMVGQVIDNYNASPRMAYVPYIPRRIRNFYVRNQNPSSLSPGPSPTTEGAWIPYGVYGKNELDSGRIHGMYESHENLIPGPVRQEVQRLSHDHAWWNSTFALNDQTGFEDYACSVGRTVRFMQTEPIVFCAFNINCSGYLDPIPLRAPGSTTERRYGNSPQEILATGLHGASNLDTLGLRIGDSPLVETWSDMTSALGISSANYADTYFFPFSHFPVGEYLKRDWGQAYGIGPPAPSTNLFGNIRNSIEFAAYVAGDPADWYNDAERSNAVARAFLDAFHPEARPTQQTLNWLVAGLRDYADIDYDPTGLSLGYPSQEPSGKLNEFILESVYTFEFDGSNYTLNVENKGYAEVWNPYIWAPHLDSEDGTSNYRMGGRWLLSSTGANENEQRMQFRESFRLGPRGWYIIPSMNSITFTYPPSEEFNDLKSHTLSFKNNRTILEKDWGAGFRRVSTIEDNQPDPGFTAELSDSLNLSAPEAGSPLVVTNWLSIEVLDPRFAYEIANTDYWRATNINDSAAVTFSNYNPWTVAYLSQSTNLTDGATSSSSGWNDSYTYMFTANKPLRTVGELAYIAYAPWKTLRLFPHPAGIEDGFPTPEASLHRVIDTFTLIDIDTMPSRKGLINPNTEHAKVLAAAFRDMPIDLHPDQPSDAYSTVNATAADSIANAIVAYTSGITTYVYPPLGSGDNIEKDLNNFFVEVSEMGLVDSLFNNSLSGISTPTLFEKEALIRNSFGLFNTRQIMVMSIMAASYIRAHHKFETGAYSGDWQYYVNLNGPRTSERRGMALTWMDAWTGRTITRQLKYTNP